MAREIHFEVFKRQGAKGGWTMHDVSGNRDGAMRMAEALMKEGEATGVKVVKETYDCDTGDYLTLKIFEDGHNQMKVEPAAEDVPHALPCFKPDDLYSYHARATLARLLAEFLARQKLTITELIHRADALEKLEATGTVYQHAVQKIAVAQASSTTTPVQQIIKSLNDLTTKAIQRIYRDEKRGYFPHVTAGGFAKLARKLASESDGAYILNGAIAKHLSDAKGWDEKLLRLLALIKEAQGMKADAAQALLLKSADAMVSEILNGAAALHEMIGQTDNLGDAMMNLVQLFLGKTPEENAKSGAGLSALAKHFAADEMADARTAIASRIMAELKSVKRLCPDSLVDELKMLRAIANKLVLGQGKYLSHEDLIAAFTLRSKRLVTHESISTFLSNVSDPDAKIDHLLIVEENIIGIENKRHLAAFIQPIITGSAFEQHFLFAKTPVLSRLQRLAELQARVKRAGFQDTEKRELCETLDDIASELETRSKFLESIETRQTSHVDKAIAVLRLCTTGSLTDGALSQRARDVVVRQLATPGFLTGYTAHLKKIKGDAAPQTPDTAMTELIITLERAGITSETGLKNIAA